MSDNRYATVPRKFLEDLLLERDGEISHLNVVIRSLLANKDKKR